MIETDAAPELAGKRQEIPRPEYPRPQFVREQWMNLNGTWEFCLDDDNVGVEQSWFHEKTFARKILVPFSIESRRSGIGDRSFHPRVWYRRGFEAPASWRGKRAILHFGAVDYRSTVWVNGIPVTWHEGGHTPFECDITGALKEGEISWWFVRKIRPATAISREASNSGKKSR